MKDVRCDQYIENLRKVRALSRPDAPDGTGTDALLECIQKNAAESFRLMKANNALLDELVYSRKAENLTDEEIDELLEFANALFAYANSEDDGIAYKIHCILLDAARLKKDDAFIIRELYNCGVSLHYLNIWDDGYDLNAFGSRVRGYFEEAVTYMNRYEEFDSETRSYLIRCLGNSKMALNRNTPQNARTYMQICERAIAVMKDPYYQNLNPEIPWKNFIYTMNIDQLSLLPYLRRHHDPEIAEKVYRSSEYVYKMVKENEGEEERVQNWRVHYFYWAARFHTGRSTAREAIEAMLKDVEKVDPNDFSSTGINYNIRLPAHMYRYVRFLPPQDRKELEDCIQTSRERCMLYLDQLPVTRAPRVTSMAVWDLTETQVDLDDRSKKKMLGYLLSSHKPTFVHSLMVARLTRLFMKQLLEKRPEDLIGLMGYQTVDELKAHQKEICEMAYECGLYHDIGKNSVVMYISTNSRRLLDEEFQCIQLHPPFGYGLLTRIGHKEDLAQAALFHHRFYDEKGGYPSNYGTCLPQMKAIVDVLNVTDSLDAATDNIGRCYTMAKPVEKLIEEFRAQKGTRYAPYVVELFDDPEFAGSLGKQVDENRKKVYLQVYRTREEHRKG